MIVINYQTQCFRRWSRTDSTHTTLITQKIFVVLNRERVLRESFHNRITILDGFFLQVLRRSLNTFNFFLAFLFFCSVIFRLHFQDLAAFFYTIFLPNFRRHTVLALTQTIDRGLCKLTQWASITTQCANSHLTFAQVLLRPAVQLHTTVYHVGRTWYGAFFPPVYIHKTGRSCRYV